MLVALEHLGILFFFPGLVRLLDFALDFGEGLAKHLREVLLHVVDILPVLGDRLVLLLPDLFRVRLDFVSLVYQVLNLVLIPANASLQRVVLVHQFFLRCFVLAGHVCHNVERPFSFLINGLLKDLVVGAEVSLSCDLLVGHFLLTDQAHLEGLDFGLEHEVALGVGEVVGDSLALLSFLSLSFLLGTHNLIK